MLKMLENQISFDIAIQKPDEVCANFRRKSWGNSRWNSLVITVPYFFLNFQMPDDYYLNKYFTIY